MDLLPAYFLCGIMGYLLGTFNLAFVISRVKGIDLRHQGSTNLGASNATIAMGWRIGILVALCDIGKAVVSVLLAKWFFPDAGFVGVTAGAFCVLGHIFPFYLRFKGGKGFASYLGMILALDWKFFLIIGVAILILTIVTDYIAIATLATMVSFPVYLFFHESSWLFALFAAVISGVIVVKHLPNIRKILHGEEIGLRSVAKKQDDPKK